MEIVVFALFIGALLCFLFDWWQVTPKQINTTLGFVFVALGLACWIWWAGHLKDKIF